MESKRHSGRLILGIVLIFLGLAFIGRNVGIFPFPLRSILFSWQMILIVLGIIFLSSTDNKGTGYILLAIGGFFLIPEIWDVPVSWGRLFWPVLLIVMGLVILLRIGTRTQVPADVSETDFIDDTAVFGGGDRVLTSGNFRGGKITAIFGGSKFDLSKAELAKGSNILDVVALFGGTKLIVPSNWVVKVRVTSILGGFSDKRKLSSEEPRDPDRTLVIKGIAMFGGGDVVNYG